LIFFAYAITAALLWMFFIDSISKVFNEFAAETVPIPLTMISMSTMQFLFILFIRNQDYQENELKRVRAARRTTFWRRFSVFSLTGFSIGTPIADGLFWWFTRFWGNSVVDGQFNWNVFQIIAFILFIWGFWEIILRIWENFEYKFSLDWLLVQIMAMFTGAKMKRSQVRPIIYGPNMYRVREVVFDVRQKVKVA
jgi:hypothetical protein